MGAWGLLGRTDHIHLCICVLGGHVSAYAALFWVADRGAGVQFPSYRLRSFDNDNSGTNAGNVEVSAAGLAVMRADKPCYQSAEVSPFLTCH